MRVHFNADGSIASASHDNPQGVIAEDDGSLTVDALPAAAVREMVGQQGAEVGASLFGLQRLRVDRINSATAKK